MTESDDSDAGGESSGLSISRRQVLFGSGGAGAAVLGGAGLYTTLTSASNKQTYIVQQGKLHWEATPLSYKDKTIKEFYNYQQASGNANPLVDITDEPNASRMFIYEGPVGTSLVFLHGSPKAQSGGTAFFKFSGLSRSKGEWAVRDDVMSFDDDFEKWEGGNSKVKWEWSGGHTDGGAFWGVGDSSSKIKVYPKTLRGVDSWKFFTGAVDQPDDFELYDQKAVKIRPSDGKRSVKQANIEIMPGSDPNAFDPYSKDTIRVAIKSPPQDADKSEWVTPSDVDPGNKSVYFGSRSYLAGGNGATPQNYSRKNGNLVLEYKTKSANFTLDSAYGFILGKTGSYTWFRGKDTVQPGGFNNVEQPDVPLVVTDLNVNPTGGDGQHLAKEYVELTNDGDTPIDMTGYTLKDAEGWQFHFPDGFTLNAGKSVRVHTGDGQWDENDLYWDVQYPVWDNQGDTITVTDDSGTVVLRHSYPAQE